METPGMLFAVGADAQPAAIMSLGSALKQKLQQLQQSFGAHVSAVFSPSEGGSSAEGVGSSPLSVAAVRTYNSEVIPRVTTGTEWETDGKRRLLQAPGAQPCR